MNITKHTRSLLTATVVAIAVLIAGVVVGACGGNSGDSSSASAAGNGVDRAFVADMTPHHKSAVEMATIAQRRGQSEFVKDLADDIVRTQTTEISTMQDIAQRLDDAGVKKTSLGVPGQMMGMNADISSLRTADPFDRAFIDMMVPHHQSAIVMARAELAKGSSTKAKSLAREIIAAQSREIVAMNKHRAEAFGSASPAGGIPAE